MGLARDLEFLVAARKPAPSRAEKRKRREPGKWERAFYEQYLAPSLAAHELVMIGYERITLRLADDCRYTPDWAAWNEHLGGVEFYEVKGRKYEDAIIKLRVAVEMYPMFRFHLCTGGPGKWKVEQW